MDREFLLEKFCFDADGLLVFADSPINKKSKIGKRPGSIDSRGYRQIRVKGVLTLEHRMVYFMVHGELPKFLDHIDRDRTNNRIENLRPATFVQNCQNRKVSSKNRSGVKGVHWHKQHKKWYAEIGVKGKKKFLGLFKDFDKAKEARFDAEKEIHGEFSINSPSLQLNSIG